MLFMYVLGLLPYVSLRFDVIHSPFITKDNLEMLREGIAGYSCGRRFCINFAVSVIRLINYFTNGVYVHLNRRGILSNYFVINDAEEVRNLCKNTTVNGIMTDRPQMVREVLIELKIEKLRKMGIN